MTAVRVLVVSKGHAYDHNAFLAMFDAIEGVEATLVDQPAAQAALQPQFAGEWDVVFFYDMSGIPGIGLLHDGANDSGVPPDRYVDAIDALLDRGTGLILVNHATVSWPNWPLWRDIHGSSFMLRAGELRGENVPGSGYRGGHGPLPNATIPLMPQRAHPVLEGLAEGFEITDELYLKTDYYGPNVFPLLRGAYTFSQAHFTAPPLAPQAERETWAHPPGSDLIVWLNACRNAPVFVSDVGDGPAAFENPEYRRLIGNACRWLASAEAKAWASDLNG
jgi:hypothetical protein